MKIEKTKLIGLASFTGCQLTNTLPSHSTYFNSQLNPKPGFNLNELNASEVRDENLHIFFAFSLSPVKGEVDSFLSGKFQCKRAGKVRKTCMLKR